MDNNAHPIISTPYAKVQLYWSINEFLAGMMMSYGCGNDQTTPINNAHVISIAYPVSWKLHSKFQSILSLDLILIAKTTSSGCGYGQTTPVWLIIFSLIL